MKTKSALKINLLLCVIAAGVFILCLMFGSADIAWRSLLSKDGSAALILKAVRLPRACASCAAGAGLALSGVLLQSATNNPLTGPNIIGVNAGAGLGMAAVMCFLPKMPWLLPWASFLGAFLCAVIIVTIAEKTGGSRTTVVLAGVAISALMNAGISAFKLIFPDIAISYAYFSVGGFAGIKPDDLLVPSIFIAICFGAAMVMASRLDLLCLGDSYAMGLGVRIRPVRASALLLASASAGAAVSFGGLIGFVGLMVPHIARKIVGNRIKALLPASCLLGMILLMLSDLLGRVILAPSEIPAGLITAVLGVPFFLALLRRRDMR